MQVVIVMINRIREMRAEGGNQLYSSHETECNPGLLLLLK